MASLRILCSGRTPTTIAWLMGYEQGVAHERGIYDATFKASDPRTARVYPTLPDLP